MNLFFHRIYIWSKEYFVYDRRQVQESHRPVVLTNRGRGVAVVQSLSDFEAESEERSFTKGILKGMVDLEEGKGLSLEDVLEFYKERKVSHVGERLVQKVFQDIALL